MTPLEYAAKICYSSRQTLEFTYDMALKYKDSNGVYVECGVAAGAQIIAMAHGAPNKIIYAFDSFQGIPLPSNRDDQMPGIAMLTKTEQNMLPDPGHQSLVSSGATVVTQNDFLSNILMALTPCTFLGSVSLSYINTLNNIKVVEGWFEETLKSYDTGEIALLRLDGDLYNSTWVCLQHLFQKVIKGGCVIIDDWNLKGCRDACTEYFELIGYKPEWKFISDIAYFYK